MSIISNEELEALQKYRGRNLSQLRNRIGDIREVIDRILSVRKQARVLEIGFGFGIVLIQLKKIYGDRIELHGINKRVSDGSWLTALRSAAMQGLLTERDIDNLPAPKLHYINVDKGLDFSSDYFDFAYSQVSFFYYDDKAFFLEELNRILKPDGLARIDVAINRDDIPREYSNCFEIWDNDRQMSFWKYIKRFENLKKRTAPLRPYLEMTKAENFKLNLKLVHTVRLNNIYYDWWGTKSVYSIVREAGSDRKTA